jgi:chromosome segregation ATPase
MRLEGLKELIEDYQEQFDQINKDITYHQREIKKEKERKIKKLDKMQELEGEINDADKEIMIKFSLIEERDAFRQQLNTELMQQLLLLIQE